ncbi:MAG: serine/threonine protein kinase [Myxococcota bacterium]
METCANCGAETRLAGRLTLLELLGEGGSSRTYRAYDGSAEREVALKILDISQMTDWKRLELFKRQHTILSSLTLSGVPRAYGMFEASVAGGSQWCFEQELIAGESLQSVIDGGRRFTEVEATDLFEDLLETLAALHALSPPLIHRDIKPSNLILSPEDTLVLIDFDTATGDDQSAFKRDATLVGTAGFVPLEQLAGQATPASDLYAAAMTLVAILSRRPVTDLPVEGGRVRFADAIAISATLGDVLTRQLSPAAEDRFQSAQAVLGALKGTSSITPLPAGKSPSKRVTKVRLWLLLACVIILPCGYFVETYRASEVTAERAIIPAAVPLGGTTVKVLKGTRAFIASLPIVWASQAPKVSSQRHERSPAQALGGVPDVWPAHLDARAAWTPQWQDAGYESVVVGFSPAPMAAGIVVFESLNPGAIYRLSIEEGGETLALWERRGPTPVVSPGEVLAFQLSKPRPIGRLTITLDTRLVPGFNALDAVGLIPKD